MLTASLSGEGIATAPFQPTGYRPQAAQSLGWQASSGPGMSCSWQPARSTPELRGCTGERVVSRSGPGPLYSFWLAPALRAGGSSGDAAASPPSSSGTQPCCRRWPCRGRGSPRQPQWNLPRNENWARWAAGLLQGLTGHPAHRAIPWLDLGATSSRAKPEARKQPPSWCPLQALLPAPSEEAARPQPPRGVPQGKDLGSNEGLSLLWHTWLVRGSNDPDRSLWAPDHGDSAWFSGLT